MRDVTLEIEAAVKQLLQTDSRPQPNEIGLILSSAKSIGDTGDFDKALKRADRVLLWFPENIEALSLKGRLEQKAGRFKEARDTSKLLIQIVTQGNSNEELANALFELAHIEHLAKAYAEAENLYTKGLSLLESSNSREIVAAETLNLARTRKLLGKKQDALSDCKTAVQLFNSLSLPDLEGQARFETGLLLMDLLCHDEAHISLLSAKSLLRQTHSYLKLRDCYLALAILHRCRNRFESCVPAYLRAATISNALNDIHSLANTYSLLAKIFLLLDQREKSISCYHYATSVLDSVSDADRIQHIRNDASMMGISM